jgi:hypothetical protein
MALCVGALWFALLAGCTNDDGSAQRSRCAARAELERSMTTLRGVDPANARVEDLRQEVAHVRTALNSLVGAVPEDVTAQVAAVRVGLDAIDDAATDARIDIELRIRTTRIALAQADSAVSKLVADTRNDCP